MTEAFWFRDREAWRSIVFAYLPWLAGLSLAWEVAHVRLYTLWTEGDLPYIAFSVLHCTLGDVLIGAAALFLALIVNRERAYAQWRWRRIAIVTCVCGTTYTVFSEWMNLTILRSWTYAESMPRIGLGGVEIGATPLAQWLVVPPVALYLARQTYRSG